MLPKLLEICRRYLISSGQTADNGKKLNESLNRVGTEMNVEKTKIMSLENTQIVIDNQNIKIVNQYIYFGYTLKPQISSSKKLNGIG